LSHRGRRPRSKAAVPCPQGISPGIFADRYARSGDSAFAGNDSGELAASGTLHLVAAQAFVKRLKTPGREVRRMFDDVSDDVIEATGKRQQPFMYERLPKKRDFFFVAGK
jgi:hypothetical protein